MKKSTLLFVALFILGTTTLIFAWPQDVKEKIIQSIQTGDAETLSNYFSDDILLELFDKEEYEGKEEVENRLKAFFMKYPPKRFKVRYEGGKAHVGKEFIIGVYQSEAEVFRITLAIEKDLLNMMTIIFESPEG